MTLTGNQWPVAILGSGDVASDLMIKILNFGGKPVDCYSESIRAQKELMLRHTAPRGIR
jgi:acetaldehyde dehydrogenase (acetylating)